MTEYTFIDRYFHSQDELLDIRFIANRDINTFFSYLNNLHSTADKLKEIFNRDIKKIPEFKLLRLLRNYFHHVSDIDEIRIYALLDEGIIYSHMSHLIIPLDILARSIKSFNENNKSTAYVERELDVILTCCIDIGCLIKDLDSFCNKPSLKLDGEVYELGFDVYKYVYNISNFIADECRAIDELKKKEVVRNLDCSYTSSNNIGNSNLLKPVGIECILTTRGFVYPEIIERAT